MRHTDILMPVFALVLLTFLVLLQIPLARIRAALRGEVGPGDFRFGESAKVPPAVSIPNRNYMNLLEIPLLFHVVCLLIFAAGIATPVMVTLAWTYVALRLAHSVIHLSYNNVIHRLLVFAASNVVLAVLWMLAFATVRAA